MDDSYIADMLTLLEEVISEWEPFGLGLKLEFNEVKLIDEKLTASDCMRRLIEEWIKQFHSEATIFKIIEACRSPVIKNFALAEKLEEDTELRERFGMDVG